MGFHLFFVVREPQTRRESYDSLLVCGSLKLLLCFCLFEAVNDTDQDDEDDCSE